MSEKMNANPINEADQLQDLEAKADVTGGVSQATKDAIGSAIDPNRFGQSSSGGQSSSQSSGSSFGTPTNQNLAAAIKRKQPKGPNY